MGHAAPVTRFTLAVLVGVAVRIAGAPLFLAPLLFLLSTAPPIGLWRRPGSSKWMLLGLGAGIVLGTPGRGVECPVPRIGPRSTVVGHLHATPRFGSAPLERDDGCGVVTVVFEVSDAEDDRRDGRGERPAEGRRAGGEETRGAPQAGRRLRLTGRWQEGTRRPWFRVDGVQAVQERGLSRHRLRWAGVRWRDGLAGRLHRLYGDRAPIVTALTLARREGLERELRDAFAVTGIAHLLAISGFHVGLIAGLVLGLIRAAGLPRRPAHVVAAITAWVYVGLIGFPAAACRAAVILGVVAATGIRAKPSTRWGGLAAAGLLLVVAEPTLVASPGFQLSFGGAAGLVAWAASFDRALIGTFRLRRSNALTSTVAAGVAATLGTLPFVAWHFERVSVVGIPMTLVATPLVSLALPGALASLLLDFVWPIGASFLAGGVSVLLDALVAISTWVTRWAWASVGVTRLSVVGGVLGVILASAVARHPHIGRSARRSLVIVYVLVGICAWPVVRSFEGRGSLELLMIDVGQGDATAIRTPRGRWLLVDAGPEAGGGGRSLVHPVVRTLRARGVRSLEILVLTHPDLDHFGGATAVLEAFRVRRVLDPALPAPKAAYVGLLEEAARRSVRWDAARSGQDFVIDGVSFRVLHPDGAAVAAGEANEASVVLLVSWGDFHALLTGDAYVDVERSLTRVLPDLDVLKVGHHGSTTSTDSAFLDAARPEVALISAGRRNRYGHPTPIVLRRLEAAGARVYRTDRDGSVRVLVDRDGGVRVVPGG